MKSLNLALFSILISTTAPATIEGENEHFKYRLPTPDEPYVDTQRDSRMLAFLGTKIMLSEDCGKTWPHVAEFPQAPAMLRQ